MRENDCNHCPEVKWCNACFNCKYRSAAKCDPCRSGKSCFWESEEGLSDELGNFMGREV